MEGSRATSPTTEAEATRAEPTQAGAAGHPEPAAAYGHRYPPHVLREYALVADGERGALCGPSGDFVWMCAPNWHSDAVFSHLLGGRGIFAVTPRSRFVFGGHYEQGSLIWRNRWMSTHGVFECREALAMPADPHRAVLLRRIVASGTDAAVTLRLDLGAGFGADRLEDLRRTDDGRWIGRTGDLHVLFTGAAHARVAPGGGLEADLTVPHGTTHDLILEVSQRPIAEPTDADSAWARTEESWRQDVPRFDRTLAARDTQHAYAVLRGLTSRTGGMVAAATTSLPERADEGRNYDYRYAWIRDQSYAGLALAAGAPTRLLDAHVDFIVARLLEHGDRLAPAYTVLGGDVPKQRTLELPGYPGAGTAVGNPINSQFQLDSHAEALQLLAATAGLDRLDEQGREAIGVAVRAIGERWQEPDAGVWELEPQRWTHSRLSCVAGLRAVARQPGTGVDADAVTALAERIEQSARRDGVHPSGRWQRSPSDERLDAALLLPSVRGGLAAEDPMTTGTLEAVRRDLAVDHFVYRYRHDPEGPLGTAEGAFLLCGFVTALAEHQQGNDLAAMRYFERSRTACGPPGLFAEEYDVQQRELRGNLPQAFVHALLLECSTTLRAAI